MSKVTEALLVSGLAAVGAVAGSMIGELITNRGNCCEDDACAREFEDEVDETAATEVPDAE